MMTITTLNKGLTNRPGMEIFSLMWARRILRAAVSLRSFIASKACNDTFVFLHKTKVTDLNLAIKEWDAWLHHVLEYFAHKLIINTTSYSKFWLKNSLLGKLRHQNIITTIIRQNMYKDCMNNHIHIECSCDTFQLWH